MMTVNLVDASFSRLFSMPCCFGTLLGILYMQCLQMYDAAKNRHLVQWFSYTDHCVKMHDGNFILMNENDLILLSPSVSQILVIFFVLFVTKISKLPSLSLWWKLVQFYWQQFDPRNTLVLETSLSWKCISVVDWLIDYQVNNCFRVLFGLSISLPGWY